MVPRTPRLTVGRFLWRLLLQRAHHGGEDAEADRHRGGDMDDVPECFFHGGQVSPMRVPSASTATTTASAWMLVGIALM